MSVSLIPSVGVAFSELKAYPEVACLLGAKALKSGDQALPSRLIYALGPLMLPNEQNPWEGASGLFWREAFKLDPTDWLKSCLGSLPKDQVKESARSLLIASAQNGAFECFDYLLSLGAARRSWKILESAYINGGWRAAEKVKKPTPKEAGLLMSYGASGWRNQECQHSGEGLLWLSKFLEPSYEQPSDWLPKMAITQPPETMLFCVKNYKALKISAPKETVFSIGCALVASKATHAALIWINDHKLNPVAHAPGSVDLYLPTNNGSYQKFFKITLHNPTLVESALMGLSSDSAKAVIELGGQIPKKERLAALWQNTFKNSGWHMKICEGLPAPSESLRETLELEASLSSCSTVSRRRGPGL